MKKQYRSSITKNHKIVKKKNIYIYILNGVPLEDYVAS